MTSNELNNGYIQLALNRMDDAKKHLQQVSNDLKRRCKMNRCVECKEKQKIIDTLQNTCRLYEARIKRFQTLAKQRKNKNRRVIKIPLKSDLEWRADLIAAYGIQVLRDCLYNKKDINHNAYVNTEVALACGEIKDDEREKFTKEIAKFAKENKSNAEQLIYK